MKRILLLNSILCLSLFAFSEEIFVKKTATGNNNGASWDHAYTNLLADLAPGTYILQLITYENQTKVTFIKK